MKPNIVWQTTSMRALSPEALTFLERALLPSIRAIGMPPDTAAVAMLRTAAQELADGKMAGACGHCQNCQAYIAAFLALADDLEATLQTYGVSSLFDVATELTTKTVDVSELERMFLAPAPKLVQ